MKLIKRIGLKNDRYRKEEMPVACRTDGRVRPEQRRIVMREAELMQQAAENYLLAPMAVRKYYLSLYCGLLEKYGKELKENGLLNVSDCLSHRISLYQDAGMKFSDLSRSLSVLADSGERMECDDLTLWF